jgi:hypothetical protein
MSEKSECPRCGSYASEVFYEGHHKWCGWNCDVDYTVSAWNEGSSAELRIGERPSQAQRSAVAALVGADSTTVEVSINGYPLREFDKKSPWFDIDKEAPKPLSKAKAKKAIQDLRDLHVQRATDDIDAAFGTKT